MDERGTKKAMALEGDMNIEKNNWKIYSLIDPRTGVVRYIGKTDNTKRRLRVHLAEAKHSNGHNHRLNWIRSLLSENLVPILIILEVGNGDVGRIQRKNG